MSAAFSLEYSGPPVPCDFPRCTLEAFHDGDHVLRPAKPKFPPERVHTCVICGARFAIYGEVLPVDARVCDSAECLLALASRDAEHVSLGPSCTCPQRPYSHSLSVHAEIRSEWWAHKKNLAWPWSLMASPREEPSTERKPG